MDLALLSVELQRLSRYSCRNASLPLDGASGLSYEAAATLLASQEDSHLRAVGLWALFYKGQPGTIATVLPDGRTLSSREMLLESHRLDPCFSLSVTALGSLLYGQPFGERIVLFDGRALTQTELFVEAIRLDPTVAESYCYLAYSLVRSDTVTLHDGRVFTRAALCQEAIRRNPMQAASYSCLAVDIGADDVVELNGRTFNKNELCIEAIRLDPADSSLYSTFSSLLNVDESVTLADGRVMTAKELVQESLRRNMLVPYSLYNLSQLLAWDETVELGGRVMTKQDLLLEAIRLNPFDEDYFISLFRWCKRVGVANIQLHDHRVLTQQELLLEAVHLHPSHVNALWFLAHTLTHDVDVVRLRNGDFRTRCDLLFDFLRPNAGSLVDRLDVRDCVSLAWRVSEHRLFGARTNVLFAVFLLALKQHGCLAAVGIDCAVVEEMLACWTMLDAVQAT